MEDDSVKLLRECNAGIKMGISSIDDVMNHVQNDGLRGVLKDSHDIHCRLAVFDACKAKAEELGKKNGWLLYPLGIALSGKQRTPGGGTDLACMMGREKTLGRVKAAIEKLNG